MAIRTFDLEIDKPLKPFYFEAKYKYYRGLVRINKQPIGWIHFSRTAKSHLTVDEIQGLIQKQLDYTIVHQALLKDFDQFSKVNDGVIEGISVVVCTRNRAQQLATCIESLLGLDYSRFEIIIVDNAPENDETFQLVKDLPVRYVREERPGLDWARNRGITVARFPIIAFTDDDVRVDAYWLKAIANAFAQKEVMGVSGYVAPAELDTFAQRCFELQYGGMGHGFRRYTLKKERISSRQLLWISGSCIGANMAFRKEVFEKIGGFNTALDVGTPSHGGGDIEIFHRLVSSNYAMAYEPSMLIWHYHRREMKALKKQLFDNGRSFGCYLIHCYRNNTLKGKDIIRFFLKDWLINWNLKNLLGRGNKIPRKLSLAELRGMLTSPFAYIKTIRSDKRIRQKFPVKHQGQVYPVYLENQMRSNMFEQ